MMCVLIVADNRLAAEAIRREMRHASGFHIAGFINPERARIAGLVKAEPDVVLVDDMHDVETTAQCVADLRQELPATKLILLTLDMDRERLSRICRAGIDAVIAKRTRPGSLGAIVRELVDGNVFHQFECVKPSASAISTLTSREREILQLAASGLSNGLIAERLWVAEQTVKFHLSNVYRKLNVANRTEASHRAYLDGLIDGRTAELPRLDERAA